MGERLGWESDLDGSIFHRSTTEPLWMCADSDKSGWVCTPLYRREGEPTLQGKAICGLCLYTGYCL